MFRTVIGISAALIRLVGTVIAAVLAVHVLLVVFGANPTSRFAVVVQHTAAAFTLGLSDLFTPADPKLAIEINYGIAAVVWLVLTGVVVNALYRIGSRLPVA